VCEEDIFAIALCDELEHINDASSKGEDIG
jgi:hypothetical protein